jgi:8-oxo-dGTP pyrophosphatase MutT (NUDIX family)
VKTVRETSAGGVIVSEGGGVVLTARRSFKGDLQWGLPKGLIDEGETPAEAALREAQEETGLQVEMVRPLDVIEYWYVKPGPAAVRVHKFVHFFLMRPTGGDPGLHDDETEEVAILEPAEALSRASFRTEKQVIKEAVSPPVSPQ